MNDAADRLVEIRLPYVLDQTRGQEVAGTCAYDNAMHQGSRRRRKRKRRQLNEEHRNAGELYDYEPEVVAAQGNGKSQVIKRGQVQVWSISTFDVSCRLVLANV